ncbi:hypothetical protein KI387_019712, partial [Taxus chinensis]
MTVTSILPLQTCKSSLLVAQKWEFQSNLWTSTKALRKTGVVSLVAGDATKTCHLLSLPRAKERMRLFKADLSKDGSFDAAIND